MRTRYRRIGSIGASMPCTHIYIYMRLAKPSLFRTPTSIHQSNTSHFAQSSNCPITPKTQNCNVESAICWRWSTIYNSNARRTSLFLTPTACIISMQVKKFKTTPLMESEISHSSTISSGPGLQASEIFVTRYRSVSVGMRFV